MPLVRLIYTSEIVLPDGVERDSELARILEVAVARNRSVGLTGALVYDQTCFLQVLEGEHECVFATLRRLCSDPRHANLNILDITEIQHRNFEGWSMRMFEPTVVTQDIFDLYTAKGSIPLGHLSPEIAFDLFIALADAETAGDFSGIEEPYCLRSSAAMA